MSYTYFIGIDIAKNFFDVAFSGPSADLSSEARRAKGEGSAKAGMPEKAVRFDNTPDGFAAFCKAFAHELPEALIVLEATGGYETALLVQLCTNGMAVHRVQPLQARHYMRSLRCFGKNDAIDAAALARYGAERHDTLSLFSPGNDKQVRLRDLHTRRADLLAMRIAEQQRAKHPRYRNMTESIQTILRTITEEIDRIEDAMRELVENNEDLKNRHELLTAFPGIGSTTALCLLAEMPELGTLTRRQAASLAGLAPHPKDSGSYTGYRSTKGGRAAVKRALFMAALAAKQYNPVLKAFYEKLVQNGKKPMVAITAVMRKMIVILNARMRDEFYTMPLKTW